jgi:hypothetical protein
MSLFSEIERTIERGFRKSTEHVFGPAESDELLLVHRAILERIEGRVQTVQRGRRIFPYSLVTVRLPHPEAARRAVYEAAFAQERRLENDIRETLRGTGCEVPRHLTVQVETPEEGTRPFEIEYSTVAAPAVSAAADAPVQQAVARLVTVKGKTREDARALERPRCNIGRLEELTDANQRVIRRNDVVFEEGADDANATVSRAHAQVRYDRAAGEYRIADEGSEYGTRIFRDGKSIEVPAGNRRGERLRNGDEIYLGRACLRFERE